MFPPFPQRPSTPVPPQPLFVLSQPKIAAWMDITIFADPIEANPAIIAVLSQFPTIPPDPALDQWFFPDPIQADPALIGSWGNITILDQIISASPSLIGSWVSGLIISPALLTANPELRFGGITIQTIVVGETAGSNWLRWSKIGSLDFAQDRSNVANQMPLPFRGAIWAILRRGSAIIVYGKNGAAVLNPAATAFGYTVLPLAGLKSKQAVVDTGEAHFCVDSQGRLWKLSEQPPQLLDYREWLSTLTSPVLSYHPERRLLYLCDGTNGYVYNVDTGSMGKGPATVTGLGLQSGTLYAVASGTMTIPNFAYTTDITDMGTRKGKTVHSFEIGVDTTLTLEGAINYRLQKQASFLSTNWYPIDSRGQCYINAYGYEFQFKARATSAGWFHVDGLRVYGEVHAH